MAGQVDQINGMLGATGGGYMPHDGFQFPTFDQWLQGLGISSRQISPEQASMFYEQYQSDRARAMAEKAAMETGRRTRGGTPLMPWTAPGQGRY